MSVLNLLLLQFASRLRETKKTVKRFEDLHLQKPLQNRLLSVIVVQWQLKQTWLNLHFLLWIYCEQYELQCVRVFYVKGDSTEVWSCNTFFFSKTCFIRVVDVCMAYQSCGTLICHLSVGNSLKTHITCIYVDLGEALVTFFTVHLMHSHFKQSCQIDWGQIKVPQKSFDN